MTMRPRRLGLTAKLTVPFVLILMAAIVVVGTLAGRSIRAGLTESLDLRSTILIDTLATALADPLSLGETDRVRQLLEKATKVDAEVAYAALVNAKGELVWATDAGRAAAAVAASVMTADGLVRRAVPGARHLADLAQPVSLQGLGRLGTVHLGVTTERVDAAAARALWTIALVGVCALVAGVGIYVGVARRVARPLNAAVGRLDELARGDADLTLRIPAVSTDEAGRLATSLNTFLEKQHTLVQEIRATAGHVGAASGQVSVAANELTSKAQEHATALEEGAASLEEITATVRQNADSARRASTLADDAKAAAEKGGSVVGAAMASMEEITRASRRIAEIIGVIDEIAFQTNLLALNAAVEAARAGEQGRGFAVVAAEVRNLAQRSAGAAKEIKTLIHDSVQKIADGSTLVNQSGGTLGTIVLAVKDVSTLVAEIAAASHEQSTGIDQVNRVVSRMDQVVQENAGHTEELSRAAQLLEGQARQLEGLVGRFRLRDEVAASGPAAVLSEAVRPAVSRERLAGERRRVRAGDARRGERVETRVQGPNGRDHDVVRTF